MIYLSGFFAKNLTKPINELVNGSQRIKEGNFNQPVLILSNDEFQTLGDIFNNMMEKLKMTMINLQKEVDNISKAHIRQKATYNISQAIITSTNLDELYSKIHAIISEVIYAENFYIALIGENTHTIDFCIFCRSV